MAHDLLTLKNRLANELFVTIEEEWGYREWFWFPRISAQELESWWCSQQNIESFWGWAGSQKCAMQEDWPGEFVLIKEEDDLQLWSESFRYTAYISHIDGNRVGSRDDPNTFLKRIADHQKFVHKGAIYDE